MCVIRKERAKSANAHKRRSVRLRTTKSFNGRSMRGGTEMLAASVASSIKFDNMTSVFMNNNEDKSPPQTGEYSNVYGLHVG